MLDRPEGEYRILTAATVPTHLAELADVVAVLGGGPSDWRVRDVADGNLNSVFLVDGPAGGVCVKQALPYARIHGEAWPLDIERATFEVGYARRLDPFVGRLAPRIHAYDPVQYVIVMETLEPHVVLRRSLIEGVHRPKVPDAVGDYVARAAFHTSDLANTFERKAADVAFFSGNLALQRISIDLVFTDPYTEVWRNKPVAPHLLAWAAAVREDVELKSAVAVERLKYLNKPQSLIHGDLHSGSVMATADDTRVIDGEFAWMGPTGFDVGTFVAHYVMAWFAKPFHDGDPAGNAAFRDLIRDDVVRFWTAFRDRFSALWDEVGPTGDAYPPGHFADAAGRARLAGLREAYLADVFRDAVAAVALKIVRRVLGYAQVADFLVIADPERQALAKAGALAFARSLLLRPERYPDLAALVNALPVFERAGLDPLRSRNW